jgi:hypothetical protein
MNNGKPFTMLDLCRISPEQAARRIEGLIKQVAELEKELKKYKCLEGDLIYIDKKELLQRDLEQQALACDWIYTKLPDYSSVNLSVITARRLELITQANTLRGKSEQIQSKSR